jgi:hypothetical protein
MQWLEAVYSGFDIDLLGAAALGMIHDMSGRCVLKVDPRFENRQIDIAISESFMSYDGSGLGASTQVQYVHCNEAILHIHMFLQLLGQQLYIVQS